MTVETPAETIRRCLLRLEGDLGISTPRTDRDRRLIREARRALQALEGQADPPSRKRD